MAKLVMIVGPQAVGKMTVGQELAKITDLKFMHNHETIDVLTNIFDICSKDEQKRISKNCNLEKALEKDSWDFESSALSSLKEFLTVPNMFYNL